jgi:hypothetical protein
MEAKASAKVESAKNGTDPTKDECVSVGSLNKSLTGEANNYTSTLSGTLTNQCKTPFDLVRVKLRYADAGGRQQFKLAQAYRLQPGGNAMFEVGISGNVGAAAVVEVKSWANAAEAPAAQP